MFKLLLFLSLIYSEISFGQNAITYTDGFEPKGILSKPSKYVIDKNLSSLSGGTSLALTSNNKGIFPKSSEILNEALGHWISEAVEVEIHGFDHEYFAVVILIYKKEFQVKFSWNSDMPFYHQTIIESTYSYLKLDSDGFQKGKTSHGYLEFKGICRGVDYEGTKFDIKGNFNFSIP